METKRIAEELAPTAPDCEGRALSPGDVVVWSADHARKWHGNWLVVVKVFDKEVGVAPPPLRGRAPAGFLSAGTDFWRLSAAPPEAKAAAERMLREY